MGKQSESVRDLFAGVKGARISGSGNYFAEGVYSVAIAECKAIQDRKGVATFIVALDVLQSTVPKHPKGTRIDWVVKMDKEPSAGNVLMFLHVATGKALDEIDGEDVEEATGEDNPLAGLVLTASCSTIETKAGRPFTKVTWKNEAEGEDQGEQRSA